MGDSMEYIYEAINIKTSFFFYSGNPALKILPELMTQRQPFYPIFLLIIYTLSINNWIVIIIQNLISIFNILYIHSLLGKMDLKVNLIIFIIFIIGFPSQMINANIIAPDILLQTFTIMYIGNFLLWYKTNNAKHLIYMSLTLIVGFMIKPVLYPFVIIHIIIVLINLIKTNQIILKTILFGILPLFILISYNFWNYERTGKFHFSSNQAFNAVYYYYPYISSQFDVDSAQSFLKQERRNMATLPDFKSRYEYANKRGWQLFQQNGVSYLLFHLKNGFRMLVEPGKAELDLFTGVLTYGKLYSKKPEGFYATIKNKGWNLENLIGYFKDNTSLIVIIIVLIINIIKLIGLFLFFLYVKINKYIKYFILVDIAYFILAAGPIGNTRYFLPVLLIVAGCSAVGYTHFLNSKKQNKIA